MSEASLLVLKEQFYDRLFEYLLENVTDFKEGGSVFIKFLKAQSNTAMDYLDNAAISFDETNPLLLNELIEGGFIRGGKEFSKYVITAKGVWEVENILDKIDCQRLVNELDDYKYDVKWGGKLSDIEKVALLTLISLRAFYKKTPLNRKNGDIFVENTKEIISTVTKFLTNYNEKFNPNLKRKTRENLVDSIFARLNKLPKKTRGLYKSESYKNWLNIYSEEVNVISEEKLGYLLWKIFGGDLSIEKQNAINNFCNEILLRHKNYIYNSDEIKNFIFSDIIHQNAISNSLFLIVERRVIWGEMDKEK